MEEVSIIGLKRIYDQNAHKQSLDDFVATLFTEISTPENFLRRLAEAPVHPADVYNELQQRSIDGTGNAALLPFEDLKKIACMLQLTRELSPAEKKTLYINTLLSALEREYLDSFHKRVIETNENICYSREWLPHVPKPFCLMGDFYTLTSGCYELSLDTINGGAGLSFAIYVYPKSMDPYNLFHQLGQGKKIVEFLTRLPEKISFSPIPVPVGDFERYQELTHKYVRFQTA